MAKRKVITQERAGEKLLSLIDKSEVGDRVYELAQELCDEAIAKIEKEYTIVGNADYIPFTEDDDEMWYDLYRDEFVSAVFEIIAEGKF